MTPHSSDDDDRAYREQDEVSEARANDPLLTFAAYLKHFQILDEKLDNEIHNDVMQLVNEATEYAENAPYALPQDALKFVYGQL